MSIEGTIITPIRIEHRRIDVLGPALDEAARRFADLTHDMDDAANAAKNSVRNEDSDGTTTTTATTTSQTETVKSDHAPIEKTPRANLNGLTDAEIVVYQLGVSLETAEKLLQATGGDLVETIMRFGEE